MNKRIIALAVLGGIAFWGYQNFTDTKPNETGKPLVSVTVPELTGTAQQGELAFNTNCAACHGKNAAGQEGTAPPLIHIIYEPNHHEDMAFILAAKRGVRQHHWRFGNMPPLPDVADEDMTTIIAYIRTLQRANGIN